MAIYPVQQAFNGGEISPLLTARADQTRYQTGALLMRNMVPMAQGPCTRRPGLRYMGQTKEQVIVNPVRMVPFVFSETQARMLEFGPGYLRVWAHNGLVTSTGTTPYEVPSPYTAADIPNIRTEQSADVVYIACKNHPPRKLMRTSDTAWVFATITFLPLATAPTGLAVALVGGNGSDVTYRYVVTTVDKDTGEESLPSAPASLAGPNLSSTVFMRLTWAARANALEYRVYKEKSGVYGFIGRALDGSVTFDDKNIGADAEDTPPNAKNPFATTGDYPALVFWWEQRLGWASTSNDPLTIWLSQSAMPESMAAARPPKDDDAIERRMAGKQQNAICWIGADRYLAVGTSGAEITLVGTDNGPLTPKNVRFQYHGEHGSAPDVAALRAGGALLYVQRGGDVVREFAYSFEKDGYVSPDLTLLCGHLFRGNRVKSWCYQQTPHSIVWCAMEDGTMRGLTYLREHDVVGWHRHDTDGFVEQVESIPGPNGDEVWALVRRTVGGVQKRYLERFDPFFDAPTPESAFFVDSGLTYSGAPATEISNLGHLEGCNVAILADGFVAPQQMVTGGKITLSGPASVVHVGLPFTSDIIPTRPEIPAPNGTTLTRVRKITSATLRLYQSMSVQAGADATHLYDVIARSSASPTTPPFVTDDREVIIDAGWDEKTTVLVRVADPTPMTMLAIVYALELS